MSHQDITLITTPLFQGLPVTHAFTTRMGGFGTGACAGGNMHYRKGGIKSEVMRNRANVFSAMGADLEGLRLVDQAHGGEVVVHSTPGEGSVFTIVLPAQ